MEKEKTTQEYVQNLVQDLNTLEEIQDAAKMGIQDLEEGGHDYYYYKEAQRALRDKAHQIEPTMTKTKLNVLKVLDKLGSDAAKASGATGGVLKKNAEHSRVHTKEHRWTK